MRRGPQDKEREKEKEVPKPLDKEESTSYESKPWHNAAAHRPSCAAPPQDNSFCMEDEPHAVLVENYLFSLSVSDPLEPGNPLVFVSPGFEQQTGYPSSKVLGVNCKVLQGDETEADRVAEIRAGMDARRFTSVELTNYRHDGRPYTNLLSIAPVVDAYDNLAKFVAVQCDLNERKRWEQVDEVFVSRWQEQVRQCLDAFMIMDSSALDSGSPTSVSSVSSGFTALTGYRQVDVLGSSCLCLAGPDSSPKALKKLVLAQSASKPAAVKLLCYKKDGSPFWGYIFSCPLTLQVKPGAAHQTLCIVVDITASRLKRVGKYVLGKIIGSGAYGIVRVGKSTTSDEIVAVKTVDGSQFRSISEIEQMQEEMNVLSSLKHPNIIRLIEVHFTNNVFFLIMEFASGGSLVKYIYQHENHRLPESEAQRVFLAMASALDYCHRRRIIHRDLKPENILMDESNNIKIADFGLAAVTAPFGKNLTQQCGTPEFAAPEITTGKEYDGPSVDIWSMGVILYEAIAGTLPFKGDTQKALCKAIQRGVYEPLPAHISQCCKDLTKAMLTVDASQRITLDQILRHPWLREASSCGLPRFTDGEDTWDDRVSRRKSASSRRSEGLNMQKSKSVNGGSMEDTDGPDSPSGRTHASELYRSDDSQVEGGSDRESTEGTHESLRLVIDGAQDDPITAAIMRAQRHMQNVNVINDHHHQGPAPDSVESVGSPKSSANNLSKGYSNRSGCAANSASNNISRKSLEGVRSLEGGGKAPGAGLTNPKLQSSGALQHREAGRRLDAGTHHHSQHRQPLSLPGVPNASGQLSSRGGGRSAHNTCRDNIGAQLGGNSSGSSGGCGQQGVGINHTHSSGAHDKGRRGTGELPQIPTRERGMSVPTAYSASKLGKATSMHVRDDAAAVAGKHGRAASVAGEKGLGVSSITNRRR